MEDSHVAEIAMPAIATMAAVLIGIAILLLGGEARDGVPTFLI